MEQSVEVGDVWIAKDQSELEIEVFVVSGDTVVCKLTKDWGGYVKGELVTYAKDTLLRIYAKEVDKKYFDGYQEGYRFGHSDASNESKQREEEIQKLAFNDGYQVGKKEGYEEGYAQAYSELHAPTTERERQLQEKAWDEGYKEGESDMLETMNELSRQQAEDWNDCREHHEPKKETQESVQEVLDKELVLVEKYPHYYKDIRHLNIIDIYRFLSLFGVTDPCLQHAAKKMCVSGKRGSKDYKKDIKEAIDTLNRWEYMQEEDKRIGE